ncbi:class II glutamine amidotransferase [Lentzea sp. NPDC003310]|uniref:class II glutamine amidotransferase n=1 Tax=Lentzea sp. NPDC003310 TaxID=3154447 RepID=UPI0033B347FE
MCRMIMATGAFDPQAVVAAAAAMSCGETADHDNKTKAHAHGWGAVWRTASGELATFRDTRPFAESAHESGILEAADFLAIHVRNATLPSQRGLEFTHPLSRPGDDWYFMHNGYLPAAHRHLGLERSEFDTREYFDCLLPPGTLKLAEAEALDVLRSIGAKATSGNAIAVRPDRAYLVHWSPPDTPTPLFFAMHELVEPGTRIVSSEVVADLAPKHRWTPLAPDCLVEILFDDLGAQS